MRAVHDFDSELAWSQAMSHEPFWQAVYRKAFPNLVSQVVCPGDHASQRLGIDRALVLSNGRVLLIEEKKRRQARNDILLEYVSVDKTNAPGWIEKDLTVDYLAYAFIPNRTCHLFPWAMLRRAWLNYRDLWLRTYQLCNARNNGYTTLSVAVPIKVLRQAVATAAIIDVSREFRGE